VIAASDFVTGSSLHAIVIAESLGIPARLITSGAEPAFKYDDYFQGSGRAGFEPAGSVKEALALGGEPPISWDSGTLLGAFPADLWEAASPSSATVTG
jgi:pyruvyltransferase